MRTGHRRPSAQGKWAHLFFRIGIVAKGIDGLLELVGGAVVFFVSPTALRGFVRQLTQHELSEDPHDWVATHLLRAARHFAVSDQTFAGIYLLSHGVLKVVLVWALLTSRLWAYPVAIVVFVAFMAYQMYRYALTHSLLMLALTVLDIFVIALTWLEYRRLRSSPPRRQSSQA